MAPDALPDPIAVALAFTTVLDRLGIAYVIGGSFASSVHGEPRSTNDIDIMADLCVEHVPHFAEALGPDYYVSDEAIREAIRTDGAFNAIHVHGGIKVDVFIAGRDAFNRERLKQRTRVALSAEPPRAIYVDTAEHSILRKLEWYRRGGETSERQWRDVMGMLRIQGERLDQPLLNEWSTRLGVADLLAKALDMTR